jgi:hypothetical protein
MNPALLEERAMRLVDHLRARGVMVWAREGKILLTPLAAVTARERAFIAANPEAITEALAPDADKRCALDRVAARLVVHAARRPRPAPRRPAPSSRAQRSHVKYLGVASTSRI